jgi:hypothetical protein
LLVRYRGTDYSVPTAFGHLVFCGSIAAEAMSAPSFICFLTSLYVSLIFELSSGVLAHQSRIDR